MRFDGHGAVRNVDGPDAVQPLEREDDAAAARLGRRSPGETGVSALREDRHGAGIAPAHHLGDFGRASRLDDAERIAAHAAAAIRQVRSDRIALDDARATSA